MVYLTFDDGLSANTEKVLDILKKENVKETFFVTGNNPKYNLCYGKQSEVQPSDETCKGGRTCHRTPHIYA